MDRKARVIALYLPQFHPVPENDKYWGKGFTEWTNVARAVPLFRGHIQPRIPADLGFYDLRIPQIRTEQAKLAKEAGIEGFCYWHYWFQSGKEVLEKPLDEMVDSKEPNYPFCIGWANHSWTTRTWEKGKNQVKDTVIFEQKYLGKEDDTAHFYRLLNAFKDSRYIKVDGRLLFPIVRPEDLPQSREFIDLWNELARENGLNGFHFVAVIEALPVLKLNNMTNIDETVDMRVEEMKARGFDSIMTVNQKYAELKTSKKVRKIKNILLRRIFDGKYVEKYDYNKIVKNYYSPADYREDVYPQLLAGWDRSPRSGRKAIVYYNDTPEAFGEMIEQALRCLENKEDEHKLLFINSWNEWGEGAYMEPDTRYGKRKLEVLGEKILGKK